MRGTRSRKRRRARPTGIIPRVWGTLWRRASEKARRGIIPACAENTEGGSNLEVTNSDHPRVCGEHAMPRKRVSILLGSSPRVRGTRRERVGLHGRDGIIPACAGNTLLHLNAPIASEDHPRVCGEH